MSETLINMIKKMNITYNTTSKASSRKKTIKTHLRNLRSHLTNNVRFQN